MNLSTFNRIKRVSDLALVLATSWFTVPAGAVTALLVRRRLGSPVLFRQARIGLDEREFSVLKFRTMTDARDGSGALLPDSERLTPVGRLLRATSLDELPQLINVVRGDMSLIGPRPLLPRYLAHYSPAERLRHQVRPGITGLAQVSGRNSVAWDERLAHDVEYVRRASPMADVSIILRTIKQVVSRQDISVLASDSGEPLDVARSYPADGALRLRRIRKLDLATRVAWIDRPEVRQHMQWPDNVTLESTLAWFESVRRDVGRVDLVAEVDGRPAAMAGLRRTSDRRAELYVFVDPARQGQGLGRRTTELVVRYAWQTMDLESVSLTVARQNTPAVRIYDALGFTVTSETLDRIAMELVRP